MTVNQINTYYVNSKTCVNYEPKVFENIYWTGAIEYSAETLSFSTR